MSPSPISLRSPTSRRRRPRWRTLAASVVLGVAGHPGASGADRELRAQSTAQGQPPRIGDVDVKGVRSVSEDQLKLAMSTKSSYCRLPLLKPVCYFVPSPFLVRHHTLEPGELERDVVTMRSMYWQRGFREATIDTSVSRGRHGLSVTFLVHEGPPTLVDTLEIERVGDLLTPQAVARAVRLERGRPLDLASLDTGLMALRNALWDAGHADAMLEPRVDVDERARRASVRIRVDPRWRTRVGSIEIEGNRRLSDAALRSALTLRTGGDFRRRDVLESQKYLYQSLGVATAAIISPPAGDSLKHIRVLVRENPPRRVGVTAGLNTIEFVQVGATAGFYALNGGRWQLDVRGATGNLFAQQLQGRGPFSDVSPTADRDAGDGEFTRPNWQGSAELVRLWAGSPRNRLSVGAFTHRRSEPSVFVDRGRGAFTTFTRELTQRSPLTLAYRLERATVDAGDVYFCQSFGQCEADDIAALREPRRWASVALNWWHDRSNSAVAPSAGYTIRADGDHASRATGSEFSHDRITTEATGYVRLGGAVLATRARGGWVRAESDARTVHPRALLFAGGAESVRGYGENQLGPRVLRVRAEDLVANGCSEASLADGSCDPSATPARAFSPRPIGGTTLLEGSVELRIPLSGSLGSVLFADGAVLSGRASADTESAVTPGLGLRYESNVGTLRFDAGWRPRVSNRVPVVVATRDVDGTTRVTRLSTERSWTDGDDDRGFRRRVTLHFVLGHAF